MPPVDIRPAITVAPLRDLHHDAPVEEFDPILVEMRAQRFSRPTCRHRIADLGQTNHAILAHATFLERVLRQGMRRQSTHRCQLQSQTFSPIRIAFTAISSKES